jgi:hypothetical protein
MLVRSMILAACLELSPNHDFKKHASDKARIMSPTENQTPLNLLRSKEFFARSTKKLKLLVL